MPPIDIALLILSGLAAGGLAGLLGVGGGVLMVPLLLLFGLNVDQAAATSLLAILVTATTRITIRATARVGGDSKATASKAIASQTMVIKDMVKRDMAGLTT